jgi:hypothetical protein
MALALDLDQALFGAFDGLPNHAAIQFNLGFTRAASHANTTSLPLQVRPPAHQACAEVLQTRQFHLQFALMAARTLGKNLQNQHGAVVHRHVQVAL